MIPKLYKVISGKYVDDTLTYLLTHQGGGVSVTPFTQDIVLTNSTIPLETGFYNTGNYGLFIGSQTPQNLIFGTGEIIYVDTSTLTIIGSLVSIAYDVIDSLWTIQDNQKIENEVTNNRDKIPTSQAVYNGLATKQNTLTAGSGISIVGNVISATGGGGGVTVTNLTQDIVISGNTIPLASGFYNTDTHYIYLGSSIASNIVFGQGEIIYVDNGTLSLIGSFISLYYDLSLTSWTLQENNYIENQLSNNRNKVPTSQAVSGALGEKLGNDTTGTTSTVSNIWTGTQTEYDNLASYSSTTLYFIKG